MLATGRSSGLTPGILGLASSLPGVLKASHVGTYTECSWPRRWPFSTLAGCRAASSQWPANPQLSGCALWGSGTPGGQQLSLHGQIWCQVTPSISAGYPNHPTGAVQAPETKGRGRALPRTRPRGHRHLSAPTFQRPQRQLASSGSVPDTEAKGKQLAGGDNSGTWPGPALGAMDQGLGRLTRHRMSPEASHLTTSSAPVTEHSEQDSKQKQARSLFIGNWLKVRHSEHGLLELAVVWLPSASVQRSSTKTSLRSPDVRIKYTVFNNWSLYFQLSNLN